MNNNSQDTKKSNLDKLTLTLEKRSFGVKSSKGLSYVPTVHWSVGKV